MNFCAWTVTFGCGDNNALGSIVKEIKLAANLEAHSK
jgi:hypothetical protein